MHNDNCKWCAADGGCTCPRASDPDDRVPPAVTMLVGGIIGATLAAMVLTWWG